MFRVSFHLLRFLFAFVLVGLKGNLSLLEICMFILSKRLKQMKVSQSPKVQFEALPVPRDFGDVGNNFVTTTVGELAFQLARGAVLNNPALCKVAGLCWFAVSIGRGWFATTVREVRDFWCSKLRRGAG